MPNRISFLILTLHYIPQLANEIQDAGGPIHGMWVAKQMSGRRCVEFFVIRRAKITKIKHTV